MFSDPEQVAGDRMTTIEQALREWGWAEGADAQQTAAFKWAEAVTRRIVVRDGSDDSESVRV